MSSRTLAAAGLLALGSLAACASDSTDTSTESAPAGCPLQVADTWVKAADSGMTGAFGVLSNPSSAPVTITGASSSASARMELHEVTMIDGSMKMQQVEGGLVVPAGDSLTLEPGGFHIMFMELTDPIEAGEDVEVTLTCADGQAVAFTAQAKEFTGGDEDYVGGEDMSDMSASPSES